MRLNVFLYFLILFIFQNITQSAQLADDKAKKIDKLMTYCYKNGTFNGTICIAENRKIIYQGAFGFADFETGLKLDTDYTFYLGSVAKQFTTMAIMILKEQGKLSYEDPLTKYFPEFPDYANKVTIRNLMTHTSGVADHFSLGANKPNLTNNDVLNLLVKQESLNFSPGEKYSYSNGGFVLLSMIVAKVSGVPFHVFMKENIFGPLGMTHSLVFDESKPDIDKRAVGFSMFDEKDDYNILTTGAGGIYSNLEDLYIWDQALYEPKLIDQQTLYEAFQPFKLTNDSLSYYGYGWGISEDESGKRVSHSGGLAGYRTYIERDLGNKNTIILLTNHGDAFALGGIRIALRNILNNKEYQLPKIPIAITISELLKTKEITEVINTYHFLKKNNEQKYDFGENQLNKLGYELLGKKKAKEAIEIFKLNVEAYPNKFNPYDSLGEAYMLNGNKELAIRNYKKSLELNPDNTNAETMLNKIKQELNSQTR